jgi:hypothetical protein
MVTFRTLDTSDFIAEVKSTAAAPETKALSEGYLARTAFLTQGADFIADQGLTAVLQQTQRVGGNNGNSGLGFAALGGGKLRHNTGSHIDVDGYNLIVGLAASKETNAGVLTGGVFIEHGEGDYDSHNSFANAASVHGKGNTQYTGGGVLAKFAFNETPTGQLYLEASARAGKVDTDFHGYLGQHTAYDSKSHYLGSHFGAGYIFKLNDQSQVNLYAQYLWSRQNSDSVKLTTGETVKFKAVDSKKHDWARDGAMPSTNKPTPTLEPPENTNTTAKPKPASRNTKSTPPNSEATPAWRKLA